MKAGSAAVDAMMTVEPFTRLSESAKSRIADTIQTFNLDIGHRILRNDELPAYVYLIIRGEVRLLGEYENEGMITLAKRGTGQLFGWVSLLRGKSCETIQVSKDVKALGIPSQVFVEICKKEKEFCAYFNKTATIQESWEVLRLNLEQMAYSPVVKKRALLDAATKAQVETLEQEVGMNNKLDQKKRYLSSNKVDGFEIGDPIINLEEIKDRNKLNFPIRLITVDNNWKSKWSSKEIENEIDTSQKQMTDGDKEILNVRAKDLMELGIMEYEDVKIEDKYPIVKGNGITEESLAIVEMVCKKENLPIRKELARKYFEDQERRGKKLSIESLGYICEGLGCQSQIGVLKTQHMNSVDYPAIYVNNEGARILWEVRNGCIITSDPKKGIEEIPIENFSDEETIKLLLIKKSVGAATTKFGWSWFLPLVNKYKWALMLVFVATLLAQMMGLAIPLLLQQIIDKVLSQGNVSTLNVLGSLMIILALFQGLLTALNSLYLSIQTEWI